jgi:hypothetical protein
MNKPKHVIDQKFHAILFFVNVKWTPKDKIYNNNVISNF